MFLAILFQGRLALESESWQHPGRFQPWQTSLIRYFSATIPETPTRLKRSPLLVRPGDPTLVRSQVFGSGRTLAAGEASAGRIGAPQAQQRTHSIHPQDGAPDIRPRSIYETAQDWIQAAFALGPEFFETDTQQSGLSHQTKENILARLVISQEPNARDYLQEHGLENLIHLLSQRLATLGVDALVQRMNDRRKKVLPFATFQLDSMARRHEEILRTVFPATLVPQRAPNT